MFGRVLEQAAIECPHDIRAGNSDIGEQAIIEFRQFIGRDTIANTPQKRFHRRGRTHGDANPRFALPGGCEFQFHSPFCRAHNTYPFVTARCGTASGAPRAESCLC